MQGGDRTLTSSEGEQATWRVGGAGSTDLGIASRVFSTINHVILGDPEVTTNIYCKLRNLPNTDTQKYSTYLR